MQIKRRSELKRKLKFEDYLKEVGIDLPTSSKIKSIYSDNDKTPSLHINTKPGKYENNFKDYSADEFGDVIKFHKQLRFKRDKVKLTDLEVRKELSEIYKKVKNKKVDGLTEKKVDVEKTINPHKFKHRSEQRLYGIFRRAGLSKGMSSADASRYSTKITFGARLRKNDKEFRYVLEITPSAVKVPEAFEYLTGGTRLLDKATIKAFNLHYIEDTDLVKAKLLKMFDKEALEISGLIKGDHFIFPNNSILIPFYESEWITYMRCRVASETDKTYKSLYKNVDEHVSKRLLNYNVLGKLTDDETLFVTESEFDAMALATHGAKAVSVSGASSLPYDSLKEIKHDNTVYAFDNDPAGNGGIQKICNSLSKPISYLQLHGIKDITEFYGVSNEDILSSSYSEILIAQPSFESLKVNFDPLNTINAVQLSKQKVSKQQWIVDDIIPTGLTLISSRPKSGKGYLAQNVANAVANGTKLFGVYETIQSGIYYITFEESSDLLISRMKQIGNINKNLEYPKIEQPTSDGKSKTHPYFRHLDMGGLDDLKKVIEQRRDIKLIILDTLTRAFSSAVSNSYDFKNDYNTIAELQQLANYYDVAIVAIHHSRKAASDNPIDEVLGTTGFTAAPDRIIVLKKLKDMGAVRFFATGRKGKEMRIDIQLDGDTGKWEITEYTVDLTPEQMKVFDCIKASSETVIRTSEIANEVKMKDQSVSRILKVLVKHGLIESPKYGSYKVKEEESSKTG